MYHRQLFAFTFWMLTFWMLTGGTVVADRNVFVSVSGDSRIVTYHLNESTGELKDASEIEVDGRPGALCLAPSGRHLFASIKSAGNLASFRIAEDGSLTRISEVQAGADPAFLATDRTGKYLVTAYYQAGKVLVHEIGDDGSIVDPPVQSVMTDEKAHGVAFDSTDRFVFIPHTGPNAIFQFRFDPTSGKLSPNRPAKLQRAKQTGPRHLWFRPDGNFAYGSDEQGSSVTAYQLDRQRGTLAAMQSVSTLPKGYADRNSTSDLEIEPGGNFVYVANRGHDTIASFSIDAESGKVKHLANTPTEKTTRSFNIDRTGRFLIAAGQGSDRLSVFRIRSDGSLRRVSGRATGSKPWWVLIGN